MKNIIKFYSCIDKIKHIERTGWKDIGVTGVKDTIASHSFGAALLGWIISKNNKLNETKIIKLLLIHDLVMAYMVDYTPNDREYPSKKDIENQNIKSLLKDVPEEIKKEFSDLFKEYQAGKTEEAMLAREADKLDTLFQAYFYSKRLGKNEFKSFALSYKKYIKSKTGKKIFNELVLDSLCF
jgi:putative hydrolase of HD superfamily